MTSKIEEDISDTEEFTRGYHCGFKEGIEIGRQETLSEVFELGERVFTHDYGNDKVTTEHYDYCILLWERLKSKLGELKK
jgi:hypothetical protein